MAGQGSFIDISGQRFGRLIVLARAASDKKGMAKWMCRCDCGVERTIYSQSLRSGVSKSCGCLNKEALHAMAKHGQSATPYYKAWNALVQRCTNPNSTKWHRYGGRGIRVCDRWLTFENFAQDMGPRPPGMTIDRRDNDGDYEPGNCRWATPTEQQNNRECNRHILVNGQTLTIAQAARAFGIHRGTIRNRLITGWTDQQSILPTQSKGN